MVNFTPLKSSIGPPAEGKAKFFARDKIVKRILRRLNLGEHLLLKKDEILLQIENKPQK